ncbi:Asp-tRNA(Asn)/Glu-tRNA(Gln) amidotransferase subunit GatB [uncultured Pseudoramibacter sp.]|jgi:aspartyl-tRNA(Asn)/glutamyl-tRNA(Gln) amidotransferase subunit B|uniref:Aspartyl/glutamyl-tRNA(Asn/Gln) amidotransferase subunit B n=1 Tax=Candidatus Pseudoramibacter fermentans TaxID=2594427 RepID=A0A6L5GRR7_9FIRM|nr:Asp-tRNA(Asn)/Glu-tRNA(Gln) amidotransferase subunit GatB [uncultured Pseudoramibacter sp.]MQM72828.1 Asp-tRNA(Asn)/Glu-tRNA(Gln) amidotransferase subunit GatB [Candidatus Pseudoramibacter fermentans]RRF93819.1 MAG: Asp-tRNA(Asn)/Glu-tRNA(Gln) amidotransferase subunit GatB [Eubacteriaceae bacterium]
MEYEIVVGMEIHAELLTKTKIFCSCPTKFGDPENTHTCPVCLGMPGVLPVLNKDVVRYAVRAGLALNCKIANFSKMDRKNYFYPDLPKAYQTSQFDRPLCLGGTVDINVNGQTKPIGITRIHIEEDAGKLLHESTDGTLVDVNRCGVPLIEIVSEPDIRGPEEARIFAEKVRNTLEYTGVSDCKMEEGSIRFDVNVSVREKGAEKLGTRTEMKNLNSFRALERAIKYESKRQIIELKKGHPIIQETRKWDDVKGVSSAMRSKEDAQDYRYFPEPDLVPITITDEEIEKAKSELPELPEAKKARYMAEYDLPEYDADLITSSKEMAQFFEDTVKISNHPKQIANWLMVDIPAHLKERELSMSTIPFTPSDLAELIDLIQNGTISGKIAKSVMEKMFTEDGSPKEIVERNNWAQMQDEGELQAIIEKIVEDNPKSVSDIASGNKKAYGFLTGQVMKATKGKANPQLANKIIREVVAKKLNK